MKTVAMIPARMAATRFPNKPLAMILGLPMIEHVRRRVAMCEDLDEVIVATCDEEIRAAVEKHGGRVIMTGDHHERCTDRIAEGAEQLEGFDIVVNVQGDEPLVIPEAISSVVRPLLEDPQLVSANLAAPIVSDEEFQDPNAPKLVRNLAGDLLYISREPIPSRKKYHSDDYKKLKQLGIISFRADFLQTFSKLAPTPLEQIESCDMMRAVEHGYRVRVVEFQGEFIGVDLPRDIGRVEEKLRNDPLFAQYA